MRILIRGGLVALSPEMVIETDVGIDNGIISVIGRNENSKDYDQELDATNCWVLPGGIDAHVHLDWDTGEAVTTDDMQSGTRAAIFGGTTTVINFIQPQKRESLYTLIDKWRDKSEGAWANYGFHIIISRLDQLWLDEFSKLPELGVHSIKVFTAYPGKLMLSDAELYQIMEKAGKAHILTMVHAENGPVIDAIAQEAIAMGHTQAKYHGTTRSSMLEAEAVFRVGQIARLANAPGYIVHLSSKEAVQALKFVRKLGANLGAETCPQYLFLDEKVYDSNSFSVAKYVYTPPSRPLSDQDGLWKALKSNDIGIVSSDHCPFDFHGAKELGKQDFRLIPNGGPGIETRVPLMLTAVRKHQIELGQAVAWVSTNASKQFGMFPQKGVIMPNSDADIIVVEKQAKPKVVEVGTLHQRIDYTPYEGWPMEGFPRDVMVGGEWVVRNYCETNIMPRGQFIGLSDKS